MESGGSYIIAILLCVGLVVAVMVVIMRAVFMIPTIVANLKRQTEILENILTTQREILKNQKEK